MNPTERDDFVYALKTTMQFYGKELDGPQLKIWFKALRGHPLPTVQDALDQYPQVGKFAPKPVDILGIVDDLRQRDAASQPAIKEEQQTNCPPEIAKAWMWFLGRTTEGSENFDGLFSSSQDIDIETQERYLHIVNHEAHQQGMPDAIPDEYKLPEVWG